MTFKLILAAVLVAAPMSVMALPKVGDVVGTKPEDASAALEKAGCKVSAYEAEGGKVEARCSEAETGKAWEVYINPKTGAVVEMKEGD